MTGEIPVLLLDISRFLSRADGVLTGVDRVEFAYLRHFSSLDTPAFGLARTTLGYLLLDRSGLAALAEATQTGRWPVTDWMSRWNTRLSPGQKQVRSLAREVAVGRCAKGGLARLLRRHIPGPLHYFNVGHSNLGDRTILPIKALGAKVSVLVHDVIPLDYPQYQRPGTVEAFATKLAQVSRHADRVICLSGATEATIRAQLGAIGRVPDTVVAPLGVDLPRPVGEPWFGMGLDRGGYVITVGTIEPRKNHALLLDVWERHGAQLPPLLICGGRGWNNDAVFRRLDAGVPGVTELSGLPDDRLAALVAGSAALLFPSFAEGYGLPPLEAAGMGVPVLVSDLPVLRETLGDHATFLDPSDPDAWVQAILAMAANKPGRAPMQLTPWESHFKVALSMTC